MKTPIRFRYCLMGMAALVVLGFAGCKPAANKVKLGGIIFQNDQFFQLVQKGMEDEAKTGGAELKVNNSDNKPDKENSLVSTYISDKVDALVMSPLSKEGSLSTIKLAADKGIKVICYNTMIDSDLVACNVASDENDLGKQTGAEAVKFINEKLGGKANIAVINFDSQVKEQSAARTKGFVDEVSKLPGVKIVATQEAWMTDMSIKKVGDILTANPDINIIWAANEGGTDGAVRAVEIAGKEGKIFVFGTDSSKKLLLQLKDEKNILQAITSQKPFDIGKKAVECALKVLKGEKVEKQIVLPGTCLTRSKPEGIKEFEEQMKKWMGE